MSTLKHLQRGGEVIQLYRKGLELSRLFPDPCGRAYLFQRLAEVFRKRATETSPRKISQHIKQGRQNIRRIERSLHAKKDYEHVVQLAYGVKGRIKHLVDAAREEANQPPKAGRPPKFLLPPIPGDARERFTLGLLALKLADERSTATHTETENESKSSEITVLTRVDPSVEAQMAVLFERVPSAWTRQTKFQPLGGNPGGVLSGANDLGDAYGNADGDGDGDGDGDENAGGAETIWNGDDTSATVGGRERFRAGWLPESWDVPRTAFPGCRPAQRDPDWETTHVALLTTTFRMDMDRKLRHGGLRRMWRRLYGRALETPRAESKEPLTVWGVPKSWRDPNVDASGEEGEERNIRLTLTHRGRVVDVMEVDAGVVDGAASKTSR